MTCHAELRSVRLVRPLRCGLCHIHVCSRPALIPFSPVPSRLRECFIPRWGSPAASVFFMPQAPSFNALLGPSGSPASSRPAASSRRGRWPRRCCRAQRSRPRSVSREEVEPPLLRQREVGVRSRAPDLPRPRSRAAISRGCEVQIQEKHRASPRPIDTALIDLPREIPSRKGSQFPATPARQLLARLRAAPSQNVRQQFANHGVRASRIDR
jgi:hypothetical protein